MKLFKNKKDSDLYAPVTGKSIPLEKVKDKVFASKMMGEGVAFVFDGNEVYSPCDGVVTLVANTLHAIGIKTNNGAEILIHIGLDAVALEGKGFEKLINQGDTVKKGTPLIRLDRNFLADQNIDLTTPMIVTNGTEFTFVIENLNTNVTVGQTKLITFN